MASGSPQHGQRRFLRLWRAASFAATRELCVAALIAVTAAVPAAVLAGNYVDNGDGTVTDAGTGLTWKRCNEGQAWTGATCTGAPGAYSWNQAIAMSGAFSFAGKSDWRLPNIRELQTIVDRTRFGPALDPAAFPNASLLYAWSASSFAGNANNAWKLHLSGGRSTDGAKTELNAVRLVRADAQPSAMLATRPPADYVDHGDGSVTHVPTALMWQRCAVGQTWSGTGCVGSAALMTWAQAISLADSFLGRTDWRLPTEDELLSLVDFSRASPALNPDLFPGTPVASFWSSTPNFQVSANAWEVSFADGHAIANASKTSARLARLVRSAAVPASTTTTIVITTTTTSTTATSTTTSTTTTTGATTTTTLAGSGGASMSLTSGWNLLGNGSSEVLDVVAAFGDQAKVLTVWKWVAAQGKWAFYTPTEGDGGAGYAAGKGYEFLTSVAGGEGFWVNAKQSFSAPLPSGTAVSSVSFQGMASGWSLIAIGDDKTPRAFNVALSTTTPAAGDIPFNVTSLWAWDAVQANWYFYAPSKDKDGTLASYVQTKNYLDFGSRTLGATTGFWVNRP